MMVGIMELDLYIYESNSLKDKRRIIRSLIDRLRNGFNISVAEVGKNNIWNRSVLGISLVSNDGRKLNKVISKILEFIYKDGRVEVVCENIEIL